jgi:hypothetical protein
LMARARTLDVIGTQVLQIDDPNQRSIAYERIAGRLLDLGMPRSALAMATLCQPVGQVAILTKAVERHWYSGS